MYIVAALYHFASVPDPADWQARLKTVTREADTCGSLLIAGEGINGTIAGSRAGIDAVLSAIRAEPGFAKLVHKESTASTKPFRRMKVRLKREIVTMGQPLVDPSNTVGHYVAPEDWNDLISAEDVVVIDTRNDYEIELGTFEGAIDPKTESFGQFPDWWEKNKDRFHNKRVAMFCTGGIRCEKSTSWLKSQGVDEVYHLEGGILKYLEEVTPEASKWQGECYVFDDRVSVGHGLKEGEYSMCYACGLPVSAADRQHKDFEYGVSCPRCIDTYSEERKASFRERQRQLLQRKEFAQKK